jgi:hypothetical protein
MVVPIKENSSFKLDNVKQLSKSLNVAVLHNLVLSQEELEKIDISHLIRLNPFDLPLETFHDLFYSTPSKYFSIKKAYSNIDLINFKTYNYASTNYNKIPFSLHDQLLQAYGLLHNLDPENINALKKINLSKEVFKIQSLSKISGTQNALDWDQVIHNLLENNIVERSCNSLSQADVSFEITTNVYSKALDVWMSVIFTYRTKLDGFSNVHEGTNCSNELIKSYNSNEQSIKPFYSSITNKKFTLDSDSETESESGLPLDDKNLELEKQEDINEKNNYLETFKNELENEELPYLEGDEDSTIYTVNNELLNKIKNVKFQSDGGSLATWIKE